MKVVFKIEAKRLTTGLSSEDIWVFKLYNKTFFFYHGCLKEWNTSGSSVTLRSYKSLRLIGPIEQLKRECYYEN